MRFGVGTVFWMPSPGIDRQHLFFVLTDPDPDDPDPDGHVVIVNMTELRDTSEDRSCILRAADREHSAVRKDSVILYNAAAVAPVAKLREAWRMGMLHQHRDASPKLVAKIIAGARASPSLKPSLLALLPD